MDLHMENKQIYFICKGPGKTIRNLIFDQSKWEMLNRKQQAKMAPLMLSPQTEV